MKEARGNVVGSLCNPMISKRRLNPIEVSGLTLSESGQPVRASRHLAVKRLQHDTRVLSREIVGGLSHV